MYTTLPDNEGAAARLNLDAAVKLRVMITVIAVIKNTSIQTDIWQLVVAATCR